MVLLGNGNEISWVRSCLGTNQFGYELVWVRTSLGTKSPDFAVTVTSFLRTGNVSMSHWTVFQSCSLGVTTQRALYVQCTYIVRTVGTMYVQCTYIVRTVPTGYRPLAVQVKL